ncbi:glycosyltransferase family 2 protein [bacterium]|nr:glycosyltransferase family 2 protein [bacterium]
MLSPEGAVSVSVIIINRNARALLSRAIVSARQWAGRQTVETIVVDNGSTDGSAEMVRGLYSNAQLITNAEDVGRAAACNQGLARARGRYILFLNSDAELTRGCLDELVYAMDTRPDVGACSPSWSPDGRSTPAGVFPRLRLALLPPRASRRLEVRMVRAFRREAECYDVDWIVGAALMVRREVVEQVGGMEERLSMWYDDIDWCLRIKRWGWRRVIVPAAYARHEEDASSAPAHGFQSDFRQTMAEYTYWRLHKGRFPTALLYCVRVARLGAGWAHLVAWNLFCHNRDQEVKQALRLAAARFGWHFKHGPGVLLGRLRPYQGD